MLQSIEMAVRIDKTVSQPIEIVLRWIKLFTVVRDSFRRDITVLYSKDIALGEI